MIVSWDWLTDYVSLDMKHDELVDRLTMSGLNHEGTQRVDGDRAIDLEVTSNRPDCLGHLGVAREIAVLWDVPLTIKDPQPPTGSDSVADAVEIRIDAPELCPRYTGRLIRGIKIGPSPDWLADRLEAIGCNLVNNVVDISNYVMYETGQPIHAFDFAKIAGGQIVVRDAKKGEKFTAIDHKEYELQPGMCVIADAENAVALGGVMGGAESEVSDETVDVLVEVAAFDPLAIRSTSRALNLMSDASHRFERPTDPEGVDWASRRCCELILQIAGGELADGIVDSGTRPEPPQPIELRLAQIPRVLGIDVSADDVERILVSLGLKLVEKSADSLTVVPPTWRHDLVREVDLIEEVARIFGYDEIPENVAVPMTATIRNDRDRVVDRVREVMTAAGFDEATTASLVIEKWADLFSPWSTHPPLKSQQPMLGVLDRAWQNEGQVNVARQSLVPSLLEVRRYNEHRSNREIELFEMARVYLSRPEGLPDEHTMVGVVSERPFIEIKGLVESLARRINPAVEIEAEPAEVPLLEPSDSCALSIGGKRCALIGRVDAATMKLFKLTRPCTVAEVNLELLSVDALLIPQARAVSPYPAISRDFNFIVEEAVRWSDLAKTVKDSAGAWLETIDYRETFRDEKKDGAGMKRLLLSITLRSDEGTLTGDQAESTCQAIIDACANNHHAKLLA